jgi:outer membrane protein OmpA-like peptidoglycan-associated protein
LNNYPNTTVNVVGHTDNTGDASYNFGLSQRRAQAVAAVLRNGGVSSSRIRSIGAGEDQPIASNLNASGRAANRRVEIIITPN